MPNVRPPAFELAAVDGEGRYRLVGEFGFETAAAALARGNAEFARHARVELDLAGVRDADSAGLAVLLAWVERARRRGATIRYVNVPQQVSAIAAITDVAALLRGAETPFRASAAAKA